MPAASSCLPLFAHYGQLWADSEQHFFYFSPDRNFFFFSAFDLTSDFIPTVLELDRVSSSRKAPLPPKVSFSLLVPRPLLCVCACVSRVRCSLGAAVSPSSLQNPKLAWLRSRHKRSYEGSKPKEIGANGGSAQIGSAAGPRAPEDVGRSRVGARLEGFIRPSK